MRSFKLSLPVFILAAIVSLSSVQAYAAQSMQLQDQASQALVKLEIMQKDKKGGIKLNEKLKRYEFITLVDYAMSYDIKEDANSTDIEFTDLRKKHVAYLQIKAAAANGIITAYKDGSIKPDRIITTGDALVMLLRALGYGENIDGAEKADILEMAEELGITGTDSVKYDTPLTRGNAAIYIYNFMTVDFAAEVG